MLISKIYNGGTDKNNTLPSLEETISDKMSTQLKLHPLIFLLDMK